MQDQPYRIMIADDDEDIVDFIDTYLIDEGYQTVRAGDGEQALNTFLPTLKSDAASDRIHLILLDVMMPRIDGFEVCRRIRKDSTVPIIMLTARTEDVDKIVGLELGADDYMPKPFNPRELLARARAVLRRAYPPDATDEPSKSEGVEFGTIHVDLARREVTVGGKMLELTAKEFDLLHFLMKNRGRVFSRPQLIDRVWGTNYYVGSRTVDVHIRRLREQIESSPSEPEYIKTVWGVGYKFAD
ncbi:MAG: response regulator transcription factor [Candidatus Poribacteria bacterium]|nr:response regulator transcription factor [Candidatus Poribacteria bacterium]